MSQSSTSRSVPTLVLTMALGAAAMCGVFAPGVARAGDEACTTKKFNYPAVEKACKEGGRKAVKEVMKGAVKKDVTPPKVVYRKETVQESQIPERPQEKLRRTVIDEVVIPPRASVPEKKD